MDGEIEKIHAETSREICRREFECETLLLPVPIGIATMVDLVVMASTLGDFSLDDHKPEGGFQMVKHPKSFQACLKQVSFAGHQAFLRAHVNMDKILLLGKSVPGYINSILEIFELNDKEAIEHIVPEELVSVKEVAAQCSQLSKEVVQEFEHVIALTKEVTLACTELKGQKGALNSQAEKELEVLKVKSNEAKKMLEDLEESKKRIEKEAEDAYAKTSKAMDDLPGATKTVSTHLAGSLINLFTLNYKRTDLAGKIHETAKAKLQAAQVSHFDLIFFLLKISIFIP